MRTFEDHCAGCGDVLPDGECEACERCGGMFCPSCRQRTAEHDSVCFECSHYVDRRRFDTDPFRGTGNPDE